MSLEAKLSKTKLLLQNARFIACESKLLLVLSHMRSRSTLLAHILGSHPQMCGYRELHRQYRGSVDTWKVKLELLHEFKEKENIVWFVDKVLHNAFELSPTVLNSPKTKIIFMIREPGETIRSIVKMRRSQSNDINELTTQAKNYYLERLAGLESLARKLKTDPFYIDSGDLIDKPEALLKDLKSWLGLKQDIDTHYSQFERTGKRYFGDPSENIMSGSIVKTQPDPKFELDPQILEDTALPHQNACASIRARCVNSGQV